MSIHSLNTGFFIVLISLLSGCNKRDIPSNPLSTSFFPNEIGDQWVYTVFDSVKLTQYDVVVAVTSSTFINNKKVNIWTFRYPESIDTNYVSVNSDTIIFFGRDKIAGGDFYVLPLSVGTHWTGGWVNDLFTISTHGTISVGGQVFQNAINIKESATSPNFRRTKDEWFTPYVGMVKKYRFERDFFLPDIKVWMLKSRKL